MQQSRITETDGDGIDRRGFLRCMAWAGTGMVWAVAGGVPKSELLGQTAARGEIPIRPDQR